MNVLTIATLLFRVSFELYLLRSTVVQLLDFKGGIFSWWFMSVFLGFGSGVMMFVVFIYVAI